MANTDNTATVTVTTSATLILAANADRHSFLLANTSSGTVFIGPRNDVTAANGTPVLQDGSLAEDSSGTKLYTSDIFGIVAAGTSDVRIWERIRGAS